MVGRLIFRVAVNSAFLFWEAARRVKNGQPDLRLLPSCIGGDPESRRGVVIAKSIPARAFKVKTGEALAQALRNACSYANGIDNSPVRAEPEEAKGRASGRPQVQRQAGVKTGRVMMKRGEQADERNL